MRKKISEMTAADKQKFLEQTKQAVIYEQGIPWELMEARILKEIEDTFDDRKFAQMDPDSRIDGMGRRSILVVHFFR